MVWLAVLHLLGFVVDLVVGARRPEGAKDLEIALLRHQLRLLQRRSSRPPGTVKLSTIDSNDDRKVGSSPRLRALISPQAQHLRAVIGLRWGGFVQSKLNVTVPSGRHCCQSCLT